MIQEPQEEIVRQNWESYWRSQDYQFEEWDSLSEVILATVVEQTRTLRGVEIMEAGCGTGRISLRLARLGFQVTCLDVAESALKLAARTFGEQPANFVQASILSLPDDHRYDLIWDAGVLEHFSVAEQRQALSQFVSVLRPDGKAVVLTPYSACLPYRLVKWILEKTGRWRYGTEVPLETLADRLPAEAILDEEYTVSFIPLLLDGYKFLPFLRRPLRWVFGALRGLLGSGFAKLDRRLSSIFGGYLLVSVIRPGPEHGTH